MPKHRRRQRSIEPPNQNAGSLLNGLNLNSLAGLINNIDINQLASAVNNATSQNAASGNGREIEDRKVEIINAIKTLINADKGELLQTIIQLYSMSKNQR